MPAEWTSLIWGDPEKVRKLEDEEESRRHAEELTERVMRFRALRKAQSEAEKP